MNAENKILLVDDEKDIVELMEEVLQKEGFHSIQKSLYRRGGTADLPGLSAQCDRAGYYASRY